MDIEFEANVEATAEIAEDYPLPKSGDFGIFFDEMETREHIPTDYEIDWTVNGVIDTNLPQQKQRALNKWQKSDKAKARQRSLYAMRPKEERDRKAKRQRAYRARMKENLAMGEGVMK